MSWSVTYAYRLLLLSGFCPDDQRFKFGFDGCYVSIDQVIKQDGLIRAQLFAALGKLEALELRDLVDQFFVGYFVMVDLLTHRLDFLIEILDTLHQLRARARSCSGFKWSRLGSEVMPPTLQIACVDSIEAKQLNFT